ncbi:TPA: LPXTG cell wall anchor domain-containing protein [Streptococcus pyogenes]|nr:LPXTG cell wall anchor domain-containing protein [Streptococcus pyogenes]HES3122814.1 LPXTG cell wall anchor domain-containing protein [Streptococcus pyogenes]
MLTSKHHNLNKLVWRYGLTSAAAVLLAFGGGASSVKAEDSETARTKLLETLTELRSQNQNDVPQTKSIEEKRTIFGTSIYDSAALYQYLEKIEKYLEKQKEHEEKWKKEITEGLESGALRGEKGVPGPKGQDGAPGERGQEGPVGPQGEKGDTGAQGPAGPQGEAGKPGEQAPEKSPEVTPTPETPEQPGEKAPEKSPEVTPTPEMPEQPGEQAPEKSKEVTPAPEKPADKEANQTPERRNGNMAKTPVANNHRRLPATGEQANPFFTAAAVAVMTTAGVLAVTKRKENN